MFSQTFLQYILQIFIHPILTDKDLATNKNRIALNFSEDSINSNKPPKNHVFANN